MVFSVFIPHVSFLSIAVVIAAAAAARGSAGVVATNATAAARHGNSSTAASTSAAAPPNESLQYICYLCHERDTLMIRWCPIQKDQCHVACLSSTPAPSSSAPSQHHRVVRAAAAAGGGAGMNGGEDDCYVMKLYPDGSWVIVDVVSCRAVSGCYLVCSYGDAREGAAAGGGGGGGAAAATTAALRGPPLPQRAADFQRCGDQLFAPRDAVVVPGDV
ncbi:hypothetical protein ACP4OV_015464 [Aristida adscensionis]